MKSRLKTLLLALAACHLAAAVVLAQEPRAQDAPGLGLQIFNGNARQPTYVSAPVGSAATLWFNHFTRLPAWREPEGALPIMAVRFARRTEGEKVHVRVTVHRGVKFYETEEFVAEYTAGVGEGYTVGELKNFGIVPFRFKVVRAEEVAPPELGVRNLTHSVEVLSAEVRTEKELHVRLVLKNLSPKKVMSLKLQAVKDGRGLTTGWPLGSEGRALIEPGGIYEAMLPVSGGTQTPGGYAPSMPDGVLVASALFSDGSYEGELEAAAKASAHYAGYRIQLARMLALIREALGAPEAKDAAAVSDLREKVQALKSDADAAAVAEVFDAFPGLEEQRRAEIKSDIEVAMSWLRMDVMAVLTHLEKKDRGPADGAHFREWLKGRRDKFEEWLGRLSQ
jgi:hypothetical protein